ncbi:hypothetical protein, partial [Caballeronia terrestris]|uniref:hypothetical protein n=1 Tax=Caballeronia terrestris TaxID=1226301 RepID=UPI001F364B19
ALQASQVSCSRTQSPFLRSVGLTYINENGPMQIGTLSTREHANIGANVRSLLYSCKLKGSR